MTKRTVPILLGILLLGLLVYWPGLPGGYVFDDFGNLVDNPSLASNALHAHFWAAIWSSGSSQLHRPLSMLSFAAQMWFTGFDPWPLKLGNVLIHLINGILIWLLSLRVLAWWHARRLPDQEWLLPPAFVALLITAAWLLAPIQLTAVLYVVQRMESLAALFVLLGLLVWWHGRMRLLNGQANAWGWIWAGLVAGTLLATLAKESGVMLPVYAFLIEWLVLGFAGKSDRVDWRLWGVFVVVLFLPALLGAAWLLPGIISGSAYAGRNFDLAQRLWTEGRVMVDYLHWITVPTPNDLSLYHDDIAISRGWLMPWTTLASWLSIAALLGGAFVLRRRLPVFSLGILWFFAGHILVSTVVPLELVYEHRNYLPGFGLFLAVFGALGMWRPVGFDRQQTMRLFVVAASVGLISLYAGFTAIRAQVWGNPFRLAYFEATTHPESSRANYDLGRLMMISAAGVESPSFQLGQQLMEKTSLMPNSGIQPLQALIFMAAKNRQPIKAAWWQKMRTRIEVEPPSVEDVGSLYSLIKCGIDGVCHYSRADVLQLQSTLEFAMRRYPKRADVVTLAANLFANLTHDYNRAYQLMLRAVALSPGKFDYWKNLMIMQMAAGQLADASQVLARLHELNPLGTHDAVIEQLGAQLSEREGREASGKQRDDKILIDSENKP